LEIDPVEPGYKHILIRPCPGGGLTRARARHESLYGRIAVEWKLTREAFTLSLELPANTRATVSLPSPSPAGVTENGQPLAKAKGISRLRRLDGRVVCDVGSGRYQFQMPAAQVRP
jgi:alpha-L-rhamnosidase